MRVQIYLISVLAGMIIWVAALDGARDLYRFGQYVGIVPNLEIRSHLGIDTPSQYHNEG